MPEINLPRTTGFRLAIINANTPNMVGQISTTLASGGLNIIDMLNKSRAEIAVTLLDVDDEPARSTLEAIDAIEGVLSVRCLGCSDS